MRDNLRIVVAEQDREVLADILLDHAIAIEAEAEKQRTKPAIWAALLNRADRFRNLVSALGLVEGSA